MHDAPPKSMCTIGTEGANYTTITCMALEGDIQGMSDVISSKNAVLCPSKKNFC